MAKEEFEVELSEEQSPDSMTEVQLGEDEKKEERLSYDEDAPNMVASFAKSKKGAAALKKVAERVHHEFTAAWDAQEEYRSRNTEMWEIFNGNLKPKTFPFEHCANAHVPILLENMTRLQTRMYGEIFNDFTDVLRVMPVGPDDKEVADILTRHGNWQLSEELTEFPRQMDRGLLLFLTSGDTSAHSYYDDFRRKNCHDVLTCDEIVVPYVYTTTAPDYSDCPWVAKVLRRYKHEIQRMRGAWYDVDSVIDGRAPSWDDEPDTPMADAQAQESGIDKDDDVRAPYKLIHWEGWLDLPEQDDERFCKVVLDHATKAVLQLQILEEDDWKDKQRYDRQSTELAEYRASMASYQAMEQAYALAAGTPPGFPMPPGSATPPVDPMTGMELPRMPPSPPTWATEEDLADPAFEAKKPRRVPIHMFSHGVCTEPLTGPLGLGYGRILTDYNLAANTVLSQFIDSATLANVKTFLMAGGPLKKPLELKPGQINPVEGTTPKDLKDSILPLDFGPANPQLVELIKMLEDWGQSATQAPSVLSGESGKSGETYRGIATRVEQATKQMSVVAGKYARFVKQIFMNNARLNAQFLPEEEIIFVNNHKMGSVEELRVGRRMYERDYRVVMRADLQFTSRAARVKEADEAVQLPGVIPALQQPGALPYQWATAKEALMARGLDHLVPLLGPPPPPPSTPFGLPPPPHPGMVPPGAPPGATGGAPMEPPPQMPSAPPDGGQGPAM